MGQYDSTLSLLRSRGIVKAEVSFSGGNDEGGVEEITLIDGAGVESNFEISYGGGYSYVNGRYQRDDSALTEDQKLSIALQKPVDDAYGSFAGDFNVYGSVIFDTVKNTVTMSKSESSYSDYEDEL